jgi:hypothetical protein
MNKIGLAWTPSCDIRFSAYQLWRWSELTLGDTGRWRSPWPWLTVFCLLTAMGVGRRAGRRRQMLSLALLAASIGGVILSDHSSAEEPAGSARRPSAPQQRGSASSELPASARLILETTERGGTSEIFYVDEPLRPGTRYSYQLFVLTSDGASSASDIAEAETLPLPTATPTLTRTPTVTHTPTATRTITPCPTRQKTRSTSGLGVGANASQATRTWVIADQVLQSRPVTLTVGGLLCWQPEGCGTLKGVQVGPEGYRCPEDNSDCLLDPLLDLHARFYYQVNDGPAQVVPGAGTFSVASLQQGDRVFLDINDHHYENNSGGFSVELRYTYRNCSAGP